MKQKHIRITTKLGMIVEVSMKHMQAAIAEGHGNKLVNLKKGDKIVNITTVGLE